MSNSLSAIALVIGAGVVITVLSSLYAPSVAAGGCAASDSYHVHGFPLQYYQEQLPASCVDPGGPAFPDAQSDQAYFGWHFYWITFVADIFVWSLVCFAVASGVRIMRGVKA